MSTPSVICSLGRTLDDVWQAAITGDSTGIHPRHIGNKDYYIASIKDEYLKPTGDPYNMRTLEIEEAALAPLSPLIDKVKGLYGEDRIAVCIGSCDNGAEVSYRAHEAYFREGTFPEGYDLVAQGASYPALYAKRKLALGGAAMGFATACSSSGSAIVQGARLLLAGIYDAVLVGGVDVASLTATLGFDALGAISPTPCLPFSANRSGITLGEGAAFFLLTREPIDDNNIILSGWGVSCDASHMTAPKEDGSIAIKAIRKALSMANILPQDIDYINLHGTGTILNDRAEGVVVSTLYQGSDTPPLSSTKGLMGHTLGASSALEIALCYKAITQANRGSLSLPIHKWDGKRGSDIPPLNFIEAGYTAPKVDHCMSVSFGFGGCNVALIISRDKE